MPEETLVVIVPGIGGSTLTRPDGRFVWGVPGMRDIFALGGVLNDLHIDNELVATALIGDITVLPWLNAGYSRFVRRLASALGVQVAAIDTAVEGAEPDRAASMMLFPYDFRRSVAQTAEALRDAIEARIGAGGHRDVIVIGHSLGGLVARYWYGPLGGHQHCRALFTVGTPHRGAPKMLDILVNGFALGPVRLPAMGAALRSWPAAFELLPTYRLIDQGGIVRRAHEVVLPAPMDALGTQVSDAADVHAQIENACISVFEEDPTRRIISFYADQQPTPSSALEELSGRLRFDPAAPPGSGLEQWTGGDKTVPAFSAITPEFGEARDRRNLFASHVRLLDSDVVIAAVRAELLGTLPPVLGGSRREALFIDSPDAVLAGEAEQVPIRLVGVDADAAATLEVTLQPRHPSASSPGTVLLTVRADDSGDGWLATVPSTAPGTYTLRARISLLGLQVDEPLPVVAR